MVMLFNILYIHSLDLTHRQGKSCKSIWKKIGYKLSTFRSTLKENINIDIYEF